ncbi:MAG: hypothetical protein LBD58_13560 [Treponema sp.]|jgi:hypothetical protein|nr:hypothetical protein [Treponema sp.]
MKRRGGYNRRECNAEWQRDRSEQRQNGSSKKKGENIRGERKGGSDAHGHLYERLRWTPPVLSTEPLPMPDCSCCGKPIRDIATAVDDKATGAPAHLDCIIKRLTETEHVEKGDAIAYIGGGRFGVVRFSGNRDKPAFKIFKIFEWEQKDNRAEWRKEVSDHYSLT